MFQFNYINQKLNKIFENDSDPLNKVRAQFLVYALLSSLVALVITLPTFFSNSLNLLFIRSLTITLIQLGLIWTVLNTNKWKIVAHGSCIVIAALIISNIFVQVQGVKIISLQWMLLLVLMSYYLLGTKWGIFYSSISLLLMMFYFAIFGKTAMTSISQHINNNFAFNTVFIYNFLLIIFLKYHFFNAFNDTIKQLKIKQAEEKLLNEKLIEAVTIAQESVKAKTYFLSTISHELRTPLNGVIGMSNILLMDNPREDQTENLNLLKFSANNLLSLINDVLDINKIESGKIKIEQIPFKFHALIKNIYNGFKSRALEQRLDFSLDLPSNLTAIGVIGDPTRLTQILANLIENALKFTEEGEVKLEIQILEQQNSTITLNFKVKDTGIGIPKDKQNIIFESFSQASTSTTRKYGGTGLGLAIVKNLLELHHSKIQVESEIDKGTTFSFNITYPLCELHPEQTTSLNHNEMDISNLKILVAEDNQMNTLLMKKLLGKWNIVPDFATNGAEAVEAVRNKSYDLILMDIHMPIMDGYEATALIRSEEDAQKAKTPIIALTASVAFDVRTKIAESQMDDYLSKPFNHEELRLILEKLAIIKN